VKFSPDLHPLQLLLASKHQHWLHIRPQPPLLPGRDRPRARGQPLTPQVTVKKVKTLQKHFPSGRESDDVPE